MVGPGVALEPPVQRFPAAVKPAAVVRLEERARGGYFRHVGAVPARSLRPLTSRAGRFVQASNASQSLAGIVAIRRSTMSASAASRALRRMNSLRLVRASSEAASSRARSCLLTRTLSTEVVMACLQARSLYDNSIQRRARQARRSDP